MVILRGLPSCGKSYRANQLVEEAAKDGVEAVIFSTDEYWYKILKPELPDEYSFNLSYLADAHKWNKRRTQRAIELGHPYIIVDNTNITSKVFCCDYLKYAHCQEYACSIEEPTSNHWKEIRELLYRKKQNEEQLKSWAAKLAEISLKTHKVPQWSIERMMWKWENNLEVSKILDICIKEHNEIN